MGFGKRLKDIKFDRGITQIELAKAVGISRTTASEYESLKVQKLPSVGVFIKIAEYLNISTDYLLGLTDNPLPLRSGIIQLPPKTTMGQYELIKNISIFINATDNINMVTSQSFSQRLRQIRQTANISTRALAKILMISGAAISSYENDNKKPSLEMLIDIVRYFKVSSDYLLCLTDNPFPIHDMNEPPYVLELHENISAGQIRFIQRMANDIVDSCVDV
jgi:transcriptional regulator with XRE-family HTH domain